ncbi:MAG: hypothetical protein A3J72_03495 [Nitrospirae bacterium RIFCSPHIGHO2_02_FULL_40_19]|nr:MAG: hypothetical protein A3J72_03495 [Nitrospirae bacterium RIFCSPHIGHO2_02_FULL_40_19]
MDKFISINGRILDFEVYKSDFALLQKIILVDQREYFSRLGFAFIKSTKDNFSREIKFYNASLDCEITVLISKRSGLEFV